ncbi:glycosyltransferase family 2 protein [Empedobacter sp. UBA7248]|uniref:glycosyltransferase family 2 protein n=1 Tax=Empedobacter sp. UBA7248 TaxID=1946448 RepID=UPI0025BCDF1E|nr:glycosyltransferase family A protein [Empedobacter sp. UBA7248]
MQQPLISVIVPCYNQSIYMDECLQSVLDQTYQNWECIIVNDGSPDNTEEVALHWVEKDTRFIYLKKENGGLSSARNAGIEKAKGEWILPLDCDDKIGSQYLELGSQQFNSGYTIIYCEAEFFGDRTGEWELPEFSLKEFAIQNLIFCSAFYRKSSWEKVKGYDESIIHGYEDWEFWISIINKKSKCYRISKVLFYYRIKEKSMTNTLHSEVTKKKELLNYIYVKHILFFVENLETPYQQLYQRMKYVEKENELLKKILGSKRIVYMNRILKLFNL